MYLHTEQLINDILPTNRTRPPRTPCRKGWAGSSARCAR